jgi:hypothetical protein
MQVLNSLKINFAQMREALDYMKKYQAICKRVIRGEGGEEGEK